MRHALSDLGYSASLSSDSWILRQVIISKLDWTQRESVRAELRWKVRRLVALYGYPPDLSEDATLLVLRAEL